MHAIVWNAECHCRIFLITALVRAKVTHMNATGWSRHPRQTARARHLGCAGQPNDNLSVRPRPTYVVIASDAVSTLTDIQSNVLRSDIQCVRTLFLGDIITIQFRWMLDVHRMAGGDSSYLPSDGLEEQPFSSL